MKKLFNAHNKEYKIVLTKDIWGCDVISIRENNKYIGFVDVISEPTQALLSLQSNILYDKYFTESLAIVS